jgi:hypothetical protein
MIQAMSRPLTADDQREPAARQADALADVAPEGRSSGTAG